MLPLLLALLSLAADPAPAPEPPKAESLSVEEATVRCESGESEVCSQVGGWLVDHNQPGRGARLLQLGCDQGHALACRNLAATLFVDTQEGGPDNVRAVALHEKACGLGEEHGCADAGWALMFGRGGVEPDPEKGRMYLDKACSLGLIQSCVELGGALATGMAGTPDYTAAQEAIGRAGKLAGPDQVPKLMRLTGSIAVLEQATPACTAGDGDACFQRGLQLMKLGAPNRAVDALGEACANDSVCGCTVGGDWALQRGAPEEGRARLVRGCDLGAKQPCEQLASVLEEGVGGEVDAKGAKKARKRAVKMERKGRVCTF